MARSPPSYQITDICQLQAMNSYLDSHFVLAGDTEAEKTSGWNSGEGFLPIGDAFTPFSGTFNGKGNTISKLFIDRPGTDAVGLFGALASDGVVRRVFMENARVTGKNQVGGLVGYSEGDISEVKVVASNVSGNHDVGGLVGKSSNGKLSYCDSDAMVQLTRQYRSNFSKEYLGGLVGTLSEGTISFCSAKGNLSRAAESGPSQRTIPPPSRSVAGGLAGFTENATVVESFAAVQVSSVATTIQFAKGLIGLATKGTRLMKSYATQVVSRLHRQQVAWLAYWGEDQLYQTPNATGDVTDLEGGEALYRYEGHAGGLVGQVEDSSIETSYATGDSTSENNVANVGILIGSVYISGYLKNCFATGVGGLVDKFKLKPSQILDFKLQGKNYSVGTPAGRTSRISLEQLTCPTAPGTVCGGLPSAPAFEGWDADTWDFGTSTELPILIPPIVFTSGTGMASSPYRIINLQQLQAINLYLDRHFELARDVEAGETSGSNSGKGFLPIGDASEPFSGTFDGKGNTISKLFINRPETDAVGLFGVLASNGMIRNVFVQDASVTGRNRVGILVAYSRGGCISNVSASGVVAGGDDAGGLAGLLEDGSIVENSSATGTVVATANAGRLAGRALNSAIKASFATGDIVATANAGGLAGRVLNSAIKASFATGDIVATTNAGGLAGRV